jgi:hypothetical protein
MLDVLGKGAIIGAMLPVMLILNAIILGFDFLGKADVGR